MNKYLTCILPFDRSAAGRRRDRARRASRPGSCWHRWCTARSQSSAWSSCSAGSRTRACPRLIICFITVECRRRRKREREREREQETERGREPKRETKIAADSHTYTQTKRVVEKEKRERESQSDKREKQIYELNLRVWQSGSVFLLVQSRRIPPQPLNQIGHKTTQNW